MPFKDIRERDLINSFILTIFFFAIGTTIAIYTGAIMSTIFLGTDVNIFSSLSLTCGYIALSSIILYRRHNFINFTSNLLVLLLILFIAMIVGWTLTNMYTMTFLFTYSELFTYLSAVIGYMFVFLIYLYVSLVIRAFK